MLTISLRNIFNDWKHRKKKNSRFTKPSELSLGTSKLDMLCLVRRRAGKEIQHV